MTRLQFLHAIRNSQYLTRAQKIQLRQLSLRSMLFGIKNKVANVGKIDSPTLKKSYISIHPDPKRCITPEA